MELLNLKAKTRAKSGTGPARRTRAQGQIPCILYGLGETPVPVVVDGKEFDRVLHGKMGEHAILKLEVEDNPALGGPALVKDVQHHPVRGNVVHADFLRFRMDEKIRTYVSVTLTGRSKGVIEGGVADQMLHEIEVECLPLEVPERIEVDITDLAIGDSASAGQLDLPAGVTLVTDPDRTVVSVHPPRVMKTPEEEAAEGAPTEPALVSDEAKEKEKEKK